MYIHSSMFFPLILFVHPVVSYVQMSIPGSLGVIFTPHPPRHFSIILGRFFLKCTSKICGGSFLGSANRISTQFSDVSTFSEVTIFSDVATFCEAILSDLRTIYALVAFSKRFATTSGVSRVLYRSCWPGLRPQFFYIKMAQACLMEKHGFPFFLLTTNANVRYQHGTVYMGLQEFMSQLHI